MEDLHGATLERSSVARSRRVPLWEAWGPTGRDVLLMAVVAGVYFAGAKVGLHLAFTNKNVTTVWPPTGISLAALLLLGPRVWPGIAIGALAANLTNGAGLETSLLITVGDTLAPVTAWMVVQRVFRFRIDLERVGDVCGLLLLGGPLAMTVSATLGSASLAVTGALHGSGYGYTWLTWWVGDTMGVLIVTPIILAVAARSWRSARLDAGVRLEAIGVLAALVASSLLVFLHSEPLTILVLPAAAWAAFRLFQLGAALSIAVVAAVSISTTVNGTGPFAHGLSTTAALMTLQAFNGAVALTTLILAAASWQNVRAQAALRRDALELQGLLDHERRAAFENMTSVVLHELRNPLAAIMNNHYLLRMTLGEDMDGDVRRHLDLAERESARATRITEDLREVSRPKRPVLADWDFKELIEQAVETTPAPDGVTLSVNCPSLHVQVDADQVTHVLTNLLANAYEALGDSGSVELSVTEVDGDLVMVSALDDGPGIDEHVLDKVFDPFVSTKPAGTGLGLAIVRRMVEAHGGSVAIENPSAGGARVTVLLPRHGPPPPPA